MSHINPQFGTVHLLPYLNELLLHSGNHHREPFQMAWANEHRHKSLLELNL